MADSPEGSGDWGCYTLPWPIGEICGSTLWGWATSANGGQGKPNGGGGPPPGAGNGGELPAGNGGGGMNGGQQVYDDGCLPLTVPVEVVSRARVPRGYVVVTDPKTNVKIGMVRSIAIKLGRWKAARKPPISASDWKCLMRANSTVKKLDRVVKMSNKVTGKASLTRSRSKR